METVVSEFRSLPRLSPDRGAACDLDVLLAQWTEDAVLLPPGGPPVVGKKALAQWFERLSREGRAPELAEFWVPAEELKVMGDWAFAWGYAQDAAQEIPGEEPVRERAMTFRILRRGRDGAWRIARWMWSCGDEPPGSAEIVLGEPF